MTITFDARYLARGWLAVATFSGKDNAAPALSKTVLVEAFPDGVRLVATDRYILMTSWVPALDKEGNPEPELDEAPDSRTIVHDPAGRGSGLMGYLLQLVTKDDGTSVDEQVPVMFRLDGVRGALPGAPATFDGMERRWVEFDFPGCERVVLEALDLEYPPVQALLAKFRPKRTTAIGLNPELLAKLGKLRTLFPGLHLVWEFGGTESMARVSLFASTPSVRGAVMPVRYRTEAEIRREEEAEAAKAGDE